MKLNSQEVIKVLDELIGKTVAVGNTSQDDDILKNLMTLIDVTNWCLDEIAQSSNTRHILFDDSMRDIGYIAYGALFEYMERLNEVTE